jgi:hypothetical protein
VALLAAAALVAMAAVAPAALAQCAMCKASLESATDGAAARFNQAILVMLAGPYLVMGVFGMVLFRERLRRRARGLVERARRALRRDGR